MTTSFDTASTPAVTTGAPRSALRRRSGDGERGAGVLNVFSHGFLLLWGAMVVLPLLWAVASSFKTDAQISRDPLGLPTGLHWENFSSAWTNGRIGDLFFNTVLVVTGGVLLTMLLGSMAAYVLARYPFPGNRVDLLPVRGRADAADLPGARAALPGRGEPRRDDPVPRPQLAT